MEMRNKTLSLYPHGTEVYLVTKGDAGVYTVNSPKPTKPQFISDARWTRSEDLIEYMVNGMTVLRLNSTTPKPIM